MDGEISSIRSQFKTTPFQLVPVCHTVLLSEFKMISMADLPDVVSHKHTSVLLTVITDDFKIASVFLSFSQILVICRLFHLVEGNNVFDKFQSSYRRNHSNDTELFQMNNILISWTKVNTQSYETYLQPLIALIMPSLLTDKAGLPSHSHYSSNFRVHNNDVLICTPYIWRPQFPDQLCFLYINILHLNHLLNSFKIIFHHFYADDALM